jgi:hypothetical protein
LENAATTFEFLGVSSLFIAHRLLDTVPKRFKTAENEDSYRTYFEYARHQVLHRLRECQSWPESAAIEASTADQAHASPRGSLKAEEDDNSSFSRASPDTSRSQRTLRCAADLFVRSVSCRVSI